MLRLMLGIAIGTMLELNWLALDVVHETAPRVWLFVTGTLAPLAMLSLPLIVVAFVLGYTTHQEA